MNPAPNEPGAGDQILAYPRSIPLPERLSDSAVYGIERRVIGMGGPGAPRRCRADGSELQAEHVGLALRDGRPDFEGTSKWKTAGATGGMAAARGPSRRIAGPSGFPLGSRVLKHPTEPA